METAYHYFAFVSYKREDEKYAKWIQEKLESYRLPVAICKKYPDLPRKISPIFRDRTDISSGMLTTVLRDELLASKYLIVICSPAAAKSEWCGLEIAEFIKAGRGDRIIPVIVSGTPLCDDPEQECFHSVIRENIPEVLGVNLNEIGKEQALIKVAARMLEIRFSELWDRFLRRKRNVMVSLVALGMLLLSVMTFMWDYYRVKEKYYADYVDVYGLPQGVLELSRHDICSRNTHYVFEYSRRKLQRVILANSYGHPVNHGNTEHVDRSAIQRFTYNDGRLLATDMYDASGRHVVTHLWGGDEYDSIDIKENILTGNSMYQQYSFSDMSYNMSFNTDVRPVPRQIRRYKLVRNAQGHIVGKIFKRNNGDDTRNVADAFGVYGYKYTLDEHGRIARIDYLDNRADGSGGFSDYDGFIADKNGIASRRYEYDSYGNLCKEAFYDLNGNLVYNEKLYCMVVSVSDKNGNVEKIAYLGQDEKPCCCADGYASARMSYDSDGNLILAEFFGLCDEPVVSREYGAHKVAFAYDKAGNNVECRLYDVDGKMNSAGGFSVVTYGYEDCNMVSVSFYDAAAQPALTSYGVHRIVMDYDRDGNCIRRAAYDCKGNPAVYYDGIHMFEYEYEEGRLQRELYYNKDLRRCYSSNLVSGVRYSYVNNILSSRSFLDINDMSCYDSEGVASEVYGYNEEQNMTESVFLRLDGERTYSNEGYSASRSHYDDKGNISEIIFLDAAGKVMNGNVGIARIKRYYDKYGNLIRQSFWDAANSRINGQGGYAEIVRAYDRRHNLISESLYGAAGAPDVSSHSEVFFTYDDRDNRVSARYLKKGEPCMLAEGYSEVRYEYDGYDREIKRSFYGTDGTLIRSMPGRYPICLTEYDLKGNAVAERYYTSDTDNTLPDLQILYSYDERGNVVKEIQLDSLGNPLLAEDGYSMVTYVYNDNDRVTEASYWMEEGVAKTDGVFRILNRYDMLGNKTEVSYYDANGSLVSEPETSVACLKYTFDQRSRIVEVACLGIDMQPVRYGEERFARKTFEFDENNCFVNEIHYDEEGNVITPAVHPDPVASRSSGARSNAQAYIDIARIVARAEMYYVPDVLNLEYEELLAIGIISVQAMLQNKTPEQLSRYSGIYVATAISWAIRNELRVRYKAYDEANKDEFAGLPSQIQNVVLESYKTREQIYSTLLSIDQVDTCPEDIFLMGYYVREAVKALPKQDRKIFEQRMMSRLSLADIAEDGDVQKLIVSLSDSFDHIKRYLESNKIRGL